MDIALEGFEKTPEGTRFQKLEEGIAGNTGILTYAKYLTTLTQLTISYLLN